MTCKECLDILKKLPEVRPDALPAAAKDHLEDCPRCRTRMAALLLIQEGTGLRAEAPAGLAGSIMTRPMIRPLAPAFAAGTRQPFLRWMPIAAAAVLAIALGSFLAGYLAGWRGAPQNAVSVHLTLEAPTAAEVAVVGDWNGWDPKAQPMKRQDGKWEIVLDLTKGRSYQYQFLIDGKTWIPDPNSPVRVDNGFGGKNSLPGL